MQHFDQNIGFWEKRHFFAEKLSKIAENCHHNIDPRLGEFSPIVFFGMFFLKISEVAQFLGNFFNDKCYEYILIKHCPGYIFGDFFTNSIQIQSKSIFRYLTQNSIIAVNSASKAKTLNGAPKHSRDYIISRYCLTLLCGHVCRKIRWRVHDKALRTLIFN
jgi:hypothetical protein